MTKEIILNNIRKTVIIQVVLGLAVMGIAWLLGWLDPFMVGAIYTWIGIIVLVIAGFFVVGGFFSGAEDLAAFSLSGAGDMDKHMKNIRAAGSSRLGLVFLLLANGALPILIGFVLQKLGQ